MARSIWDGSISFGLVNIPVSLAASVRDKSVHFHTLSKDGCRLRQKLYCPETKREYEYHDTVKGFEVSPDHYVIVDKEELQALRPESSKTIEIRDFVPLAEIDPICFERSYYLSPGEKSCKAYELLLTAMKKTDKVAVAQFVMRQKEYLAVIRPLKNALCLETLYFADEIVDESSVPGLAKKSHPDAREMSIAIQLVDSMTGPFRYGQYEDTYSKDVRKLLKAKAAGKKIVASTPEKPESTKVLDLMTALKKSFETREHGKDTKKEHGKVRHLRPKHGSEAKKRRRA